MTMIVAAVCLHFLKINIEAYFHEKVLCVC